ncbi:hypothetical protein DL96DRAFT_1532375 [Flagelloscypha sp. PMI_526]|nr:hypothetical protein DL96DRAFT_1532375 [Flagelloscypha sp. PMI_526]
MTTISPDEASLTQAILDIKAKNSSLGISKIQAQILRDHSEWTVSEKRVKKILQSQGLVQSPIPQILYPSSREIPGFDLTEWIGKSDSEKVAVRYFDQRKGKGLVAKTAIKTGDVLWKEDPWILAPEWEIYDLQQKSIACGYCSTPFPDPSSRLIIPCASEPPSSQCPIRFCNRLCYNRAQRTHPLVCLAQNPAVNPLIKYARNATWMGLHALAQSAAKLLLLSQLEDQSVYKHHWEIWRSFAELGMEERHNSNPYLIRSGKPEPDRAAWKNAFKLFVEAFHEPPSPSHKKKLAKIFRKKPVPLELKTEFFEYSGFLRGLGRMGLNTEAHGGIYVVHSHINHNCNPNISIRHLDQRTALSKITVIAKRDIEEGEELFITYVNPELPYKARQSELAEWGFGSCDCKRCMEDSKKQSKSGEKGGEGNAAMDDLASELKAGLGVF